MAVFVSWYHLCVFRLTLRVSQLNSRSYPVALRNLFNATPLTTVTVQCIAPLEATSMHIGTITPLRQPTAVIRTPRQQSGPVNPW